MSKARKKLSPTTSFTGSFRSTPNIPLITRALVRLSWPACAGARFNAETKARVAHMADTSSQQRHEGSHRCGYLSGYCAGRQSWVPVQNERGRTVGDTACVD